MRSWDILKRVIGDLGGYRKYLVGSILLAVVYVAATLTVPILFGDIIDLFLTSPIDTGTLVVYFVAIACIIAVAAICHWLMNRLNNAAAYGVANNMRKKTFASLQELSIAELDKIPVGEIVSRTVSDTDAVSDGLIIGFSQFFVDVLTILGTLVLMFVFNWLVAIAVVVLTPISLLVARYISNRSFKLFKKTAKSRGDYTAFSEERLDNMKCTQAFSREEEDKEKFEKLNDEFTGDDFKSVFTSSLTNPSSRMVNNVVYVFVIFLGALCIISPPLASLAFTAGRLTTLLSYANQYSSPFNDIADIMAELSNVTACAARVYEIEDADKEDEGEKSLEKARGDVRFSHVAFSYDPEKSFMTDINLEAKSGQIVAIVGETGCGKTTLINLLMRFYDPSSGKITVDGEDTRELSRSSLRSNFSMVLQETWIRSGTVKENIALGRKGASDEEIVEAAMRAHAHSFIMGLKDGYDTEIREGGLSEGQRQLLCLARVMLSLKPMLILDEATSSIDALTEAEIQKALKELMRRKTCFVVAHRLSTIMSADEILVMSDGQIVERGTHAELMERRGRYFDIYKSQFDFRFESDGQSDTIEGEA